MTSHVTWHPRAVVSFVLLIAAAGVGVTAHGDSPNRLPLAGDRHSVGSAPSRSLGASFRQRTAPLRSITPKLPLVFEHNQGQAGRKIQFIARASGYTALIRGPNIALNFHRGDNICHDTTIQSAALPQNAVPCRAAPGDSMSLDFVGGRKSLRWKGKGPLPGRVNYLLGRDPRQWITDVPLYSSLKTDAVRRTCAQGSE